ncbi:MAG: hypothetical protein EBS05_00095 [Proteobacteria bacterium]|nr:hypothetical protein [Pseudomonadota bacterium]
MRPTECPAWPARRTLAMSNVRLLCLFGAFHFSIALISAADATALAVRDRYLLLDSRVIERTENAELRLGTVTKHPQNPLFKEDQPWEVRFDNLYANLAFDESAQLYRCWYSPFIVDPSVNETPPAQRATSHYKPHDREMGLCYATSRDGLMWEKPALGLIEFNGSKANNLVARRPHGSGIFRDAQDPDPARRFKLFSRTSESVRKMSVAFSPDGLKWSEPILCPEINVPGDTHNNAFWSPELGKYVGITRLKTDQRLVGRTESPDFIHWTKAVEVLRGDRENQTYAMPVFRHAGVYLGLLAMFNTKTDRTHCELAWSPDTVTWHRILPGKALIPAANQPGAYDWGCVYPAAVPVVLKDGIRLYYGASNGPHTDWRDGFLALATLRPDGFAGYTPTVETRPAIVITQALKANGKALRITADVTPGGWVKASLIDAAGKVLVDGPRLTATTTDGAAADATAVLNQSVRVQLEIQKATVFSFAFAPN